MNGITHLTKFRRKLTNLPLSLAQRVAIDPEILTACSSEFKCLGMGALREQRVTVLQQHALLEAEGVNQAKVRGGNARAGQRQFRFDLVCEFNITVRVKTPQRCRHLAKKGVLLLGGWCWNHADG